MLLILLLIGVLVIWAAYKFTVYALPCVLGVAAGGYAFETGAGWLGASVVWGVTALAVFGLMRWLYASVTAPVPRVLLAVAYAAPSALLGYFLFEDLSAGQIPSDIWRQGICGLGAGFVALIALVRLSEPEAE